MRPIGWIVLMNTHEASGAVDAGDWQPMALTRLDEGRKELRTRNCLSLFPTEVAAYDALRDLSGQEWVKRAQSRICAVFSANDAAPHDSEGDACGRV